MTIPFLWSRERQEVTSHVSPLQVEEGSAKLDQDFSHSSAKLIQFDPGPNTTTTTEYY